MQDEAHLGDQQQCTNVVDTAAVIVFAARPGHAYSLCVMGDTSRKNSPLLSLTTVAVRPAALDPLPEVYTEMGACIQPKAFATVANNRERPSHLYMD